MFAMLPSGCQLLICYVLCLSLIGWNCGNEYNTEQRIRGGMQLSLTSTVDSSDVCNMEMDTMRNRYATVLYKPNAPTDISRSSSESGKCSSMNSRTSDSLTGTGTEFTSDKYNSSFKRISAPSSTKSSKSMTS